MTGGAAVGDIDRDGDLDLFVTRLDASDLLFRNLGDGTFEDASTPAGLSGLVVQSNGAAFGDIDNDGDLDLYVTTIGEPGDTPNNRNYLFMNDGNGVFAEEAIARGAAVANSGERRAYSVSFGDYDRDGWLDIHTTEWAPIGTSNSRLLRNMGPAAPGVFEDTTVAAGVALDDSFAFASTFTDLDGDRWPDLAVAADFLTSRLFWNNGDGTFTDGTVAAQVGTDQNGMGSTFGDLEGDGDLDWFVTSIYDGNSSCDEGACNWGYEGNRLYRNDGGRMFTDVTSAAGVANGYWGWGTAFFDHDNDGDLDLVMTNGVDFPAPWSGPEDPFNEDPMRMWDNDGSGVMTEISASLGLTDTGSGKGLLVFDFDSDGDQDVFIVNNGAEPRLYRNDVGNANSWLRVRTIGSLSNRDGVGARITMEMSPSGPRQVREIGTSTHFLGQSEPIAHFGLGQGTQPVSSVTVEWPSGRVQRFAAVPRNSILVAEEAACTDADADLHCSSADCHDGDAAAHAGAPELCDGSDNDCDGAIDEGCRCQRAIAKYAAKFTQRKTKYLVKCAVAKVDSQRAITCPDPSAPAGSPGRRAADKIGRAAARLRTKINVACGGADHACGGDITGEVPLAEIAWPAVCPNYRTNGAGACGTGLGDCGDIASCLECTHAAAVDQALARWFDDLTPSDPGLERTLNTCQQTIGKESGRVLVKKSRLLQKCWADRLERRHVGACPDPQAPLGTMARKTADKIERAKSQARARICRKCGGSDRACGGGDDLVPATIGFTASCDAVTIPGGASCAGTITGLTDLVDCVECGTDFAVDCMHAMQVPQFVDYPADCNP